MAMYSTFEIIMLIISSMMFPIILDLSITMYRKSKKKSKKQVQNKKVKFITLDD